MYSLINNSTIPNLLNYVSTARLSAFCFNKEATIKIINALNINQTDDHENISVWMIKLCRSLLLYLPLSIISRIVLTLEYLQVFGRDLT